MESITLLLVSSVFIYGVLAAMPQGEMGEVVHVIPEVVSPFNLQSTADPIVCTSPAAVGPFNLAPLIKTTGDYKGADSQYDYKMNVCAKSNAGGTCSDKNYAICQFAQGSSPPTFVASLGSFDQAPTWSAITLGTVVEPIANGVMYTMLNGDTCWIAGRQQVRTVLSVFRCSADPPTDTFSITEDQTTCTFTITLKTSVACPGGVTPTTPGGGMSGGSIFLILLFSCIPVYIGVGFLYGMKMKQLAGIEAFPHIAFWRDLPGLVKDGCRYTFNMARTGCKSGHKEQYDAL